MDNALLTNMFENFHLTDNETMSILWLIILLTLITRVFVHKGWVNSYQTTITDIIVALLDGFVLIASDDTFIKIVIVLQLLTTLLSIGTDIAHYFTMKKISNMELPIPVTSVPDNTVVFAHTDLLSWYFIAYDKEKQKYVAYKNFDVIDNVEPEELFGMLYNDVLQKDTYDYRTMYNLITSNKKPEEKDFEMYPIWWSNMESQNFQEERIEIAEKVFEKAMDDLGELSSICGRAKISYFTPDKIGHITLSSDDKKELLSLDKNNIYRTNLHKEGKQDVLGSNV